MAEAKRKKGETFESLLRRFNGYLIRSKRLYEAKDRRFFTDEPSENRKKADALVRHNHRLKMDYKRKTGEVVERRRRRR
jgi:ribosomal protein S21